MSYYEDGPDSFDDYDANEREELERWERVYEMEREVEDDGGDPADLYSFD